jgi:hypothetical protein
MANDPAMMPSAIAVRVLALTKEGALAKMFISVSVHD